jgi:PAS domain S-box-containing protein
MNKDISSYSQSASLSLQAALEYAENIISTIREPLLVLDPDLRIISANQSFYRVFSYARKEIEGKLIFKIGKGCWDIPELRKLLEEILPRNTSFEDFEAICEIPHLGQRIMLLNARRIHNGGGKTEKILLAIEDITERKRMEHDMTSSELRYRRLFETAQDGILLVDAENGEITDVNPFLVDMLGYSKQELSGKKLWEIGFFKDVAASRKAFLVLQDKGYVRYEDLPLETKDGRAMPVEFVSNVYAIDGEKVIQCNIRDIRERKKAADEIKKLNDSLEKRAGDLEAANKELESFSYSVSHDLRAPLRTLDGFSQIILEDYRDRLDARGKEYLQHLRSSSQLMGKLIEDILSLSRVSSTQLETGEVNLSDLANEVEEELKRTQPERRVEFKIASELTTYGDRNLLKLVLDNLMGNAFKFTGKNPQALIEFGKEERQGHQVFFIKDNGAGFDMAHADKLFQPFRRLHSESEFPGTGIGLASVSRIIHRHNGKVWAQSEKGQGATFYFSLG